MTPKLQQALKLLQMPAIELQQMLKQEIMENPLLEEVEDYLEIQEEEERQTEPEAKSEEKTDGKEDGDAKSDEEQVGLPIAVSDLQQIVLKLKDRGLGVLITDHNVRDTLTITERSYVMYEGSIKRSGTPAELAEDSEVREIYLGESFRL